MKKVILGLLTLFIGAALADSAPTSVGYVDSQIGALQNKISAVDTNTVLTHTNTAGEIGQKSIYDATGNYAEQTDALVTAEVANAAIQNAIDTEFVCIEWLEGAEHTNENCLIYNIVAANPTGLPSAYTALEYIESTGTQYIDTGIVPALTGYSIDTTIVFTDSRASGVFGYNYDDSGTQRRQGFSFSSRNVAVFGFGDGSREYSDIQLPDTNVAYKFNAVYGPSISTIKYNNQIVSKVSNNARQNPRSIYLMSTNSNSVDVRPMIGKMYYTNIWDTVSNANLFEGIPARRNSDGKLGMYDLVSNTFFTNAGTGEFIAPNYLPSGN